MASASGPLSLRTFGVLLASFGVVLWLVFAAAGAPIIVGLVDGHWSSEASRYLAIHRSLDPEARTTGFYVEQGQPVLLRLAGALVTVGALLAMAARRLERAVKDFFAESAMPQDLAVVRITVFGAMVWWWLSNDLTSFTALPSALVAPPPGLAWASGWLPRDPSIAGAISLAFAVASLSAMVGFQTRASAWAATTLGIAVLGIPQFFGKIDHYHHFVWFGALLASSPCGDAWSIDAWRARQANAGAFGASRAYAFPLRTIMLLIGSFYFFAGFWKIVIGGPEWVGETMRTIIHAQWMRIDWVPALRVDSLGAWTSVAGMAVLAFEWLFVVFILFRATRRWAALAGVVFHASVLLTMGINFWTLLVCYTVFVDTARFRQAAAATGPPARPIADPSPGVRRLGGVLIGMAILAGTTLVDSWPVAVYPTFAGMAEPYAWTVTLEGSAADGRPVRVRPWRSSALRARFGNSRVGGLVSQVAWTQDPERRRAKAVALASVAVDVEPALAGMTRVLIYRELVAVDPDRWSDPPRRRELLGEWRNDVG